MMMPIQGGLLAHAPMLSTLPISFYPFPGFVNSTQATRSSCMHIYE